jgi:hypothetical protein
MRTVDLAREGWTNEPCGTRGLGVFMRGGAVVVCVDVERYFDSGSLKRWGEAKVFHIVFSVIAYCFMNSRFESDVWRG